MSLPKPLVRILSSPTREKLATKFVSRTFPRSLPATLSRLPNDGVGHAVRRNSWQEKNFNDSWWEITRVKLKCEGQRGHAWGRLWWRGKLVTDFRKHPMGDEPITGGTKHSWLHIAPAELESLRQKHNLQVSPS